MDELLAEIDAFLKRTQMPVTVFGLNACNDGKLIPTLKKGRRVWPETAQKIRAYIKNYKAPKRLIKAA